MTLTRVTAQSKASGRMAIVGFSPRLNDAGKGIRAMQAIGLISDELSLNVFGSGR